jgi:hypothetical protein
MTSTHKLVIAGVALAGAGAYQPVVEAADSCEGWRAYCYESGGQFYSWNQCEVVAGTTWSYMSCGYQGYGEPAWCYWEETVSCS